MKTRGRALTVWTALLGVMSSLMVSCEADDNDPGRSSESGAGGDEERGGDGSSSAGSPFEPGGQGGASPSTAGQGGEGVPLGQAGQNEHGGHAGEAGAPGRGDGGAPPTGGSDGAGAGGEAGQREDAGCGLRHLFGTYRLQAHNEVRSCWREDLSCSPPDIVEDQEVTFSLYQERHFPHVAGGVLNGPGITLSEWEPDQELWVYDLSFDFHEGEYPGASEDIWNPETNWQSYSPPDAAKTWVRVSGDVCYTDFDVGFVHIDIELATGRVLNFARLCNAHRMTFWDEYRLSGTGERACDLACNDIVNDAPAAQIDNVDTIEPMTQGPIASGTYHLQLIDYVTDDTCDYQPLDEVAVVAETLVVDAYDATSGRISTASRRARGPETRSEFRYTLQSSPSQISPEYICGEDVLAGWLRSISYTASETELQLQVPIRCLFSTGSVTYTYRKQ